MSVRKPSELTEAEARICAELLEVIVRPGEHDFWMELARAQQMFGYPVGTLHKPYKRSFYGIHKPVIA